MSCTQSPEYPAPVFQEGAILRRPGHTRSADAFSGLREQGLAAEQDDMYPFNLAVKVNGESLALPAPIPCKVSGGLTGKVYLPIDIMSSCSPRPCAMNEVCVTWEPVSGRDYVVGLFLVKKLTVATVLSGLEKLSAALTRVMVKIKVKRRETMGDDVTIVRFHVSLTCPLSQSRIKVPCRARSCKHLDCFDGYNYLQTNEQRPTWTCPVCGLRAPLSCLVVDELFEQILANVPGTMALRLHRRLLRLPLVALCPPPGSSSGEQVGWSRKQPRMEVIDLTNSGSCEDRDCGSRC
ncbi:hypothetical protein MRX96_036426 [Rhipicephalus microplus]